MNQPIKRVSVSFDPAGPVTVIRTGRVKRYGPEARERLLVACQVMGWQRREIRLGEKDKLIIYRNWS